ncbi:MAG TPA: hypothetical protein PKL63_07795 [Dermatophilaceae bacterium]|nr:hypothetical protein [Dermatophilaceae bacterium]
MYAVRRTSAALLAAVVLALVPGTSAGLAASPVSSTAAGLGADGTPGPAIEETLSVPVGPEPDGTAVALDVTVFRPGGLGQHSEPWSAVLLAHGSAAARPT